MPCSLVRRRLKNLFPLKLEAAHSCDALVQSTRLHSNTSQSNLYNYWCMNVNSRNKVTVFNLCHSEIEDINPSVLWGWHRGCAVAQAVSLWLPTAAARVCVQAACGGLWWTKWHCSRFSPSTSVSPANHSTNLSIIIITRGWHNRPISSRSAEWTQTPPSTMVLTEILCSLRKEGILYLLTWSAVDILELKLMNAVTVTWSFLLPVEWDWIE
jgi:hypothetical protein